MSLCAPVFRRSCAAGKAEGITMTLGAAGLIENATRARRAHSAECCIRQAGPVSADRGDQRLAWSYEIDLLIACMGTGATIEAGRPQDLAMIEFVAYRSRDRLQGAWP